MKMGKGTCSWCGALTMFATHEGKNTHFVCLKCYYWRVPKAVISAIIIGFWHKFKGKKLIILLLCVILLSGCGTPDAVTDNQLQADYDSLLADYDYSVLENERLGNVSANLTAIIKKHNQLANDYHALQTKYTILEAYYNTAVEQHNKAIAQYSDVYVYRKDAMKDLNLEYARAELRLKNINIHLDAVHDKNVPILSDNLTDIEYSAFYKGWELWWGTFNE